MRTLLVYQGGLMYPEIFVRLTPYPGRRELYLHESRFRGGAATISARSGAS